MSRLGWQAYAGENVRFFTEPLPGRDEALGSPGGAAKLGVIGADTPMIAGLPPR
jgi:hypothetical protein